MHTCTILIGDSPDLLSDLISELFEEFVGERGTVKTLVTSSLEEFEQLAEDHAVDLLLPVINNMHPSERFGDGRARIERVLQTIAGLKAKHGTSVIAFAGWPNDPDFESKTAAAGVDRFFPLPFNPHEFMEAVANLV